MQTNKIIRFFEKYNLSVHANAIWQRDSRLRTWTIVWPQNSSKVRRWDSHVIEDKAKLRGRNNKAVVY